MTTGPVYPNDKCVNRSLGAAYEDGLEQDISPELSAVIQRQLGHIRGSRIDSGYALNRTEATVLLTWITVNHVPR